MNKKIFLIAFLLLILLGNAFALSRENLLAYYDFNETGSVLMDYAGQDNNGANTGTTQGVSGKINSAYTYAGSTGSYSDLGALNGTSFTNMTLNAWIKTTDTDGVALGKDGGGANQNQYRMYMGGTAQLGCGFYTTGAGQAYSTTSFNNTTWKMGTCVFKDGNTMVYVNGVYEGSVAHTQTYTTSANAYFGRRGNTSSTFAGSVDEASVWTRALSSSEIAELYNGGNGTTYCGAGYDNNFMQTCTSTPADPCARTLNQSWLVTTAIDCNSKTIDLGTGRLIISTGGKLRLFSSTLTAKGWDMNASGAQVHLTASWIKVG